MLPPAKSIPKGALAMVGLESATDAAQVGRQAGPWLRALRNEAESHDGWTPARLDFRARRLTKSIGDSLLHKRKARSTHRS